MGFQSIIYGLSRVFPALIAVLSLSFFTHAMTPEVYGLYSLVSTAALMISGILFSWLVASLLRYWDREEYDQEKIISTVYAAYLFILGLTLVSLFIANTMMSETAKLMTAGFALLNSAALQYISLNLFNARQQAFKFALLSLVCSVGSFSLAAFMTYIGMSVDLIISAMAVGLLIPSLVFGYKDWSQFRFKNISLSITKKFLIYGLPLSFTSLVDDISNSIDRYMIAHFIGIEEAGKYGASYDLSGNSIFVVLLSLNLAAYPMIINRFEKAGLEEAKGLMQQYFQALMAVGLPALVGLNLVAYNLVHLIIGEEFRITVLEILPWVSSALFAMGFQIFYFDYKFQMLEKSKILLYLGLFAAISNVVMNWYLIPLYGMMGAAYATLISMVVGTLASIILGNRMMPIKLSMLKLLQICFSTMVMAGSILWMQYVTISWWWLGLQMLLAIIVYSLMLLMFNILDIRTIVIKYISDFGSAH